MIDICRYTVQDKDLWNDFNRQSRNSLFMFDRNYMDYHSERFKDHSLMFYDEGKLIAIMAMNESNNYLASHGGLTYGGLILSNDAKQNKIIECFSRLIDYAKRAEFDYIIYKTIPHFYHRNPAEDDRYALFLKGAELIKVEASTLLNLRAPLKMPKGRKAQIARARREGVVVKEYKTKEAFEVFIELENRVLEKHHNTKAVHTAEELYLLYSRFPENIHLFCAELNSEIIAGSVIYEYENVIHTQYMAADDTARRIGALDFVINTIINKYINMKNWLDFGISTEDGGKTLNTGLISQKEGFGGRTSVYTTWRLQIN